MTKLKKKRNKAYKGEDARLVSRQGPTIHRYTAPARGSFAEWWHERKHAVKIISIGAGAILLVGALGAEMARVLFFH